MAEKFYSGFVSLVGRPNVGKSTLMNRLIGEKIAIISNKPQTTRNRVQSILTKDNYQIVFIDTPGIHRPRTKLGEYMTDAAVGTFKEVDVVMFIVDDRLSAGPGDKYIVELLDEIRTPKVLIINKIDKMTPEEFAEIYKEYDELGIFEDILGVSAKEGSNIEKVIKSVSGFIDEGPMYFPDDMVTEHPERFIVSEIIREKILMYLQDEVPHGVAVEIERYKEEHNLTRINAVIYCERKSHKGMIIGKGGRKLKGIGKSAREEIEALLGTKVYLEMWVKVKENWRDSDIALSNFGYKE